MLSRAVLTIYVGTAFFSEELGMRSGGGEHAALLLC